MKKYIYKGEIEGAVAGVGILKRGDVVTAASEEQERLIETSGLFEDVLDVLHVAEPQTTALPVASVEGVTQSAEIKVPEVADPATADPGTLAHTMPAHVAQLVSDFAQEAVQGQQASTISPAPAAETGAKDSEA